MGNSTLHIPSDYSKIRKGLPICIAGIAAALFIIVTINVLNGNLDSWNDCVYSRIALLINPVLTHIMTFISFWGQWFICMLVAALLLAMPKTRKSIGMPVAFSVFSAVSLSYMLKRIIAIPRPDVLTLIEASGYGHPSGHTTRATAFLGMCAILVCRCTNKKSTKISVILLAVLLSCLMGFSRIYLGAHTATDTVAAYLTGVFVIICCDIVLQSFNFWKRKNHCAK